MSYRRLLLRSLCRPPFLRHSSALVEGPSLRYNSVLVDGSDGKNPPLLARASISDVKPKTDFVIERKVLAYPPPHYFDTHKVITQLKTAGYSSDQAEAIVALLSESLQGSLEPLWASITTQKEMELLEQRISGELKSVRANLVLVEKTAVENLRSENEMLKKQVQNLTNVFKEEVIKVQSGLQLDLNLEKSRIKEEATGLEQKVKDTNNRIDFEVAQLRTQIESQKVESIKYLAGGIFSIVTIIISVILGLWRLLK